MYIQQEHISGLEVKSPRISAELNCGEAMHCASESDDSESELTELEEHSGAVVH